VKGEREGGREAIETIAEELSTVKRESHWAAGGDKCGAENRAVYEGKLFLKPREKC